MKAVLCTHLALEFPELIADLEKELPDLEIMISPTREDLLNTAGSADIIVYGRPDEEVLDKGKQLKAVIIPFTGVNRLDMSWFTSRNILLGNTHGNAPYVAERAVGLALAVTGRIAEFHNDLMKGEWHQTDDPVHPFDYWYTLRGKKISILGTGAIGREIAALLSGFKVESKGLRLHPGNRPAGFDFVTADVDEALSFGNVIFIALPLTANTENLLNGERLRRMEGKYIINIARGKIIEEKPFYDCLHDGILAGAGIDAWYTYPRKEDSVQPGSSYPFHTLTNVVLSPHAAGHTREGMRLHFQGALENVRHFATTGKLKYAVNTAEGY